MMSEDGYLGDREFAELVRNAPLVSMDLVIRDSHRRVLMCLRQHEPAKNCFFVPGGRIRKNETLAQAFERILEAETGCRAAIVDAQFMGVYQHFYPTNRFEREGYGTHYVVLAHQITLDEGLEIKLDSQHSTYLWADALAIAAMPDVHEYTKTYFSA